MSVDAHTMSEQGRAEGDIVGRARALGPLLAESAGTAERERRLAPAVVEALAAADLFQMYRPSFLGGPDTDPLDALAACEALARHDGSAAWCVQVSNAVAPMLGSIDPAAAAALVAGVRDLRLAGSARPLGTAHRTEGGYVISGRWNYASNVNHANWFMASSFLVDPSDPIVVAGKDLAVGPTAPNGTTRRVVSAYVPVAAGSIIPTWDVVGLRGTGSDDFVLDDVFVPTEMTAAGRNLRARTERRFHPRLTMTVTWAPVAGVSLGIARGAIDELAAIGHLRTTGSAAAIRSRRETQAAAGQADVVVRAARALVVDAIAEAWASARDRAPIEDLVVARSLMAISHSIRECARAVDLVFHGAGTAGISAGHGLERRFRDAHAALAHVSASPNQIEIGGRAVLGLPTEHPYF